VRVLPASRRWYNTALCFVWPERADGTVFRRVRYRRVTTAIGGLLAIIAALVLAEAAVADQALESIGPRCTSG